MSRVSRHHLLGSCAVALSIGATAYSPNSGAQVFLNQALQGTYTVTTGAIDAARTSQMAAADKIVVTSGQTVLDWIPSDSNTTGTIEFLKPNTSAMFVGPADFIVLNRVIPTDTSRAIAINGNVSSTIDPGISAPNNGPIGGSVWFYSPGGIVVGSTGSFNVGNLVLSTAELQIGPNGLLSSGNTINFGTVGAASPAGSGVTIMNGANIQLNNPGSYLAVVAPIIVQAGTVNVDGSVAYVAAEQANISIDAGLFNINFVAGTTAANAITHTGITTGPAQTGNGNITIAAISKNNAITSLLLSGLIGYTPASSASVENGQVVLLGGYSNPTALTPVGSGVTNIQMIGSAPVLFGSELLEGFTSSVTAKSNGDVLGSSGSASTPLSFSSNVTLFGNTSAQLNATNGGVLTVGGNLALTSVSVDGSTGGTASLTADWLSGTAASLTVNGKTTLDTSGSGLLAQSGAGGTGIGGTSSIVVKGSSMTLLGDTMLTANGSGGGSDLLGGIGKGGTASIVLQNTTGAGLTATNLSLTANGTGGEYGYGAPTGGAGTGGTTSFLADNAGVVGTSMTMTANGYGGHGSDAGTGGTGKGGNITFNASSGSFTGALQLEAVGTGGGGGLANGGTLSGAGGAGVGGTIGFVASGAFNTSNLTALAGSNGGDGGYIESSLGGSGGDGGRASDGNVTIAITGGNSSFGAITADTTATGGNGGTSQTGSGASNIVASKGGDASAGDVIVNITGGTSQIRRLTATADGYAGGSGYSSIDQGGTATTVAAADAMGGTVAVNIASTVNGLNSISLSAEGIGGYGAFYGAAGAGGMGTGGPPD
ncbi:beta strand repeat-containing protein [Sphingomonas paeninsulae]|nr:hypothetical protein [Sphingomonas paeninsulae]